MLFLVVGTLSFGTSAVLIKLCRFPAGVVASLRLLVAGIVLTPWAAGALGPTIRKIGWARVAATAIPGLLLGLHFQFWVLGIRQTTAAAGTFIFAANPVLFVLVERVLYRRAVRPSTYLCLFMIAAGAVWLFAVGGTRLGSPGDLLCFLSTLVFVGYLISSERVSVGIPHALYLHLIYTAGGLLTLPLAALGGGFSAMQWNDGLSYLWLGCLVALPTLLGHGSATYAVRYFTPLLVSFFTLAEPILATLYALAILAEVPRLIEVPAYLLFVCATGVFLVLRLRPRLTASTPNRPPRRPRTP